MSLDQATRSKIEQQVTGNKVVLYMKGTPQQPMCGFSAKTIAMVSELVSEVATYDVLADQDIREGIKVYGDWPDHSAVVCGWRTGRWLRHHHRNVQFR